MMPTEALHPDLFGGETPIIVPWQPDGCHADRPGSGPDGRTCGSCAHCFENDDSDHTVRPWICDLVADTYGGPIATDDPACASFEQDSEYEDDEYPDDFDPYGPEEDTGEDTNVDRW